MRRVVLTLLLFLLPFAVLADNHVFVTSMRVFPAATKTVIFFEMSAKATGVVRFIPSENKLILKFENTDLIFRVSKARLRGANITGFSTKELPDKSVEFYFDTTGKVDWTTDYEVNMDSTATKLRFEIVSVGAPVQITPKNKNNGQSSIRVTDPVQDEILKQLGKYKDKLEKLKTEQEELIGRARWDKHKINVEKGKSHLFTVVIDAGHGGKDSGAVGQNGTKEKDVVLSIARKLAAKMEKTPGIRVIMTRKGDYYVSLRGRLNLARRDDADLYIAVHADAYYNNDVRGASVYALSQHGATSEASRWLAKQENYSEIDGIDLNKLPDRSRMLRSVLIDLSQTATIRDSLRLGNKVLDALDRVSALHYRHVEQAPFVVLKSPDTPSILIETGFISNPSEEAQLRDPVYQDRLAEALCHGVNSYIRRYAGR